MADTATLIEVEIPIFIKLDFETRDVDPRIIEFGGFGGLTPDITHKLYALDVQGVGGHVFARITGELLSLGEPVRQPDGSYVVSATAGIMPDDFGIRVANLIDRGLLNGMSADLNEDSIEFRIVEEYDSETGEFTFKRFITKCTVDGGTLCEKPAFGDATGVRLLQALPEEFKLTVAKHVDTCDGCAEEHPCESCSASFTERSEALEAELQAIIESAPKVGSFRVQERTYEPPEITRYDRSLFERPELRRPTPFQYDEKTGRIWGHLAAWNAMHGAMPGNVRPPRSSTDYAYFANMPAYLTDGGMARVGRLVCDTVHAKIRGVNAEQTMAHYISTGQVFGLVAVGEDEHGIWVSGAAQRLNPELLTLALSCPPSGDWRPLPGVPGKELIVGLAVAVPGFNTPMAEFAADANAGLIVSNVPIDESGLRTGALDAKTLAQLGRIGEWVERQIEREEQAAAREAAENRRNRVRELAASYA